jgi:hypothetical protein
MIKKIDIPIFHGTLILMQGIPLEEAFGMVNLEYDPEEPFGAYTSVCYDRSGRQAFVIIFDDCDNETIAHESVHIAHRIVEEHGIEKDEELIAYLTGWVATQCHKYLKVA